MENFWAQPLHKEQFEKNGFLVIDLFQKDEIDALKHTLEKYTYNFEDTFYSSSFIPDDHIRKEISLQLKSIIRPRVQQILKEFKELGAVFLIKPPHQNSIMPIHQDWTVVDESRFHSITFWIPLQDTTVENGAIKVLPTSHKLCNALRSPTLKDPIENIKHLSEPLMQTLEMKVGQVFIFTHALWHSSFPNLSTDPRIAVAYGVVPEEAELIYFHKEKDSNLVEQLSIPEDFFISYPRPGERPLNSKKIKEFHYDEKVINDDEFKKHFRLKSNTFWEKIKNILK